MAALSVLEGGCDPTAIPEPPLPKTRDELREYLRWLETAWLDSVTGRKPTSQLRLVTADDAA